MSNSKWFFGFNGHSDRFYELECEISENPTYDELNGIAQRLLRTNGYTKDSDYVEIGKGKPVTIEKLGGCLGVEIIEMLETTASDNYGCEDIFSAARDKDIKDLDRRILQALKEWVTERNVMTSYHEIPDTDIFYYQEEEQK